MKSFLLFTITIITSVTLTYGQREVTTTDSITIKKAVDNEAALLKTKLQKSSDYLTEEERTLAIEFTIDTFRINATMTRYMEIDGSTHGMVDATYRAETEYDKLLNKYYKKLIGKLTKEDQEVLKRAQRNWIAYRDSERELIYKLSEEKYSGGGTMQRIIVSSQLLELTQKRVLEIYSHLLRLMINS